MSGFEGRVMEVFWDGFDKSIRAELDWFWRDQRTLTDVTVCCENGSVRAHKLVLALSSSYFHNMCVQSQSACSNSVISLPDVKVEDFKLILEYMYRGKVFIDEMAAERLIKLARVLHIKGFGSQNRPPKERQRSGSESSQYVDSDDNEGHRTKRPKVHIRPEEIALDNVPHNRVTRATASNRALTSANDTRNARSQTPTSRRVPGPSRVRKLSEPQECSSSKNTHEKLLSGSMIGDAFEEAAMADEPGPSGTRISSNPRSSSLEATEKPRVRNAKIIDKQGHNTSALVEKAGPSGSKISKLLETSESPENQDPSREKRPLLKRRSSTSPAKQLTKNVTLLATQSADSKSTPNISAALSNLVTNDNDTLRDGALPGGRFSLSEKCNECDFTAGSAVELATHKIQEHTKPRSVPKAPTRKRQMSSPLSDETKEAAKDDQLYVCDLCGFSSKNRGALGSHRNRHKFEQETTSPKNLPLNLRANSVHFKPIYDCPKCINISFKTLNVMSRHFARRHFDENLQYITRVACSHCVHSYSQSDGSNEYKKHLKEIHGIEAEFEISEKLSLNLSKETNPSRRTSLFENGGTNEPSPILTNGNGEASRPEPGPSGVNHTDSVPTSNDHLVETASNADTERASSRGSFVVSLNEISAKAPTSAVDLKRSRLSNDDETTIEADLSKVKMECSRNSSSVSVFHKCTDCNYQTSQLHFLRRHAIACHSNGTNEDPFLCRFCNFATAHRSTIKSHLVSVHRDSNTKISECYRNSERIREFFQANGTTSAKEPQRLQQQQQQKQQTKTGRVRLTKSAPPAAVSSEADESEGSPSPDNNNKEKSVIKKSAKKHGRPSQQFDAALKLKKAALAKQRNLSPQNCAISETKAAHLSRTRASPRRSSSRQSAAGNPQTKRRSSAKFPASLKCPDCTYEAKSYQMFTKHSILHQDVDETKLALCEVCGVVKLKSSMFYHLKKHQVDPPKTPARLSQ